MSKSWLATIERLVAEQGVRQGYYYVALITSNEVLQAVGAVITVHNHRNVANLVKWHYPKSTIEPVGVNGILGWKMNIRIRSK